MLRRLASVAAAALTFLSAASALALQQPNGATIPAGNGLQNLFNSRNEAINALATASINPQTFIPTCALTFTVLQRNAGYKNSFGWYNITGNKPTAGDLHEFLKCNDGVGTVKVLDIKADPGYAGGEIGFYEATGGCATPQNYDYLFFSEPKYNPDGNQANPYIHLLIYQSVVTANAFYFGWEDLLSGGDNDFDDLTTFVEGIYCSGGGAPCDTGLLGICGDGVVQCQNGVLTCVPSSGAVGETCDGLDNDCNGLPDDGMICPAGEVCDKGSCVKSCNGGEFTCSEDKVCSPEGFCVDPSCVMVTCADGQKCIGGVCLAPCDNVVCPHGQVCRVGVCVDPCVTVTCDVSQICVAGVCMQKCDCAGCLAGESCEPSGACLPTACIGSMCPVGQFCAPDGTCQDSCAGAMCPTGQVCETGACVPAPEMGTGGGGQGGSIFAGVGGGDPIGTGGNGNGGMSGGTGGAGGGLKLVDPAGCGCRAVGDSSANGAAVAALAMLAAIGGRRRPSRHTC